jgi:opine dehydrogenase
MSGSISVLGAGNGGQTISAHLAMQGFKVKLGEHPEFRKNIDAINKKGGIELTGALSGFGQLELASIEIASVIEGAEFILLTAPSFAQEPFIELALPHLKADQIIVLIPGNFGSLEMSAKVRKRSGLKGLVFAETNSLPYACRQSEPGKIDVWGMKSSLSIAALPAEDTQDIVTKMSEFFPTPLSAATNVLEIALSNPNMIIHCPTMILNAGRIESEKGQFRFYSEGMAESVCKVMEAMDQERIRVGSYFDLELESTANWLQRVYGLSGDSLYELLSTSPVYGGHGYDAPRSMQHRYINEDIPNLLVPVVSFGELTGVDTPVTDCIISLASVINAINYKSEGRNLKRLGLSDLSAEDIKRYVQSRNEER